MSGTIADASDFKPNGLRTREYGKFRSPRGDEVVVGSSIEGVATYPASVNATLKDETTVIAAPGAGKCIRVKTIMVNNVGANQLVVSLQEGTTGAEKFKNSMPQYGSMWNLNLIGAYWILKDNTSLEVNISAIGNVWVEVGYDIVKGLDTALTDSLSIAEDLETVEA
jgi:hypothetical protein